MRNTRLTNSPSDASADAVELAPALRYAIMRSSRRLRKEGQDPGLTPMQYSVLTSLESGPLTPSELARREQVRPPWMTRTVRTLVDMGLVARAVDPTDRRQVSASLTAHGLARIELTRAIRTQWLASKLADLDDRDRTVLAEAAEILTGLLSE